MSKQEEQRAQVLTKVLAGSCTVPQAAGLLGVGPRQTYRLVSEFRREGPRAVVHGNRGRKPAHAASDEIREQVVALATGKYAGFNHSHLTEMLAEHESIALSRASVGRILRKAGLVTQAPAQTKAPLAARALPSGGDAAPTRRQSPRLARRTRPEARPVGRHR